MHLSRWNVALTVMTDETPEQDMEDLLATYEPRYITWANLSIDLLSSYDGGDDGAAGDDFFSLSDPVDEGQRIDFFISHSWQDDVEVNGRSSPCSPKTSGP